MKQVTKELQGMPYVNVTLMDGNGNPIARNPNATGMTFGTSDGVEQALIEVYPEAIAAQARSIVSTKLRTRIYEDNGGYNVYCNYNFPGEDRPEVLDIEHRLLEIDVQQHEGVTQNPLQIHLSFIPMGTGSANTCTLLAPILYVECEEQEEPDIDSSETDTKEISLGAGVKTILHLPHGRASTFVAGMEDPALGVSVSYIHQPTEGKSFYDCLQNNWQEKLVKNQYGSYEYIDSLGKHYEFGEIFYSIDENGEKIPVLNYDSREDITVDADGRLWLHGREVFLDSSDMKGLRLVTRLSDFNDSEWLEQRYDEEKDAEEHLDSLEDHLCSFALVRSDTCAEHTTVTAEMLSSPDAFEEFAATSCAEEDWGEVALHLLTKDEALSCRSLLEQKENLNFQLTSLAGNVKSLLLQMNAASSFDYQRYANALQWLSNYYEDYDIATELEDINWRLGLSSTTDAEKAVLWRRKSSYESKQQMIGMIENQLDYTKNGLLTLSYSLINAQEGDHEKQLMLIKEQINNFPGISNSEYTDDETLGDGILTKQYAFIQAQIDHIHEQLAAIFAREAEYREELPKRYKEYHAAKKKVEELAYAAPVAFILNGSNVHGFNRNGQLVTLQTEAGKHISIAWDRYTTDGARRLASVLDENENRMSFYYDEEDRLHKIANSVGEETRVFYENDTLRILRPSMPPICLTCEENRVASVVVDEHDKAELSYDTFGRLERLAQMTSIKKIAHGRVEMEAEFSELEVISLLYGEKDVTVTYREAGTEEILCFDESTRYPCGRYTVENGVVTQAKRYSLDIVTEKPMEEIFFAPGCLCKHAYANFEANAILGDSVHYEYDAFKRLAKSVSYHYPVAGRSAGLKTKTTVDYTYGKDDKTTCVKTTLEEYYGESVPTKTTVSYELTAYNSAGKPVRTESYTEGKETLLGKDVSEIIYDDDGKQIKRFSYNTLSPSDKTYTESETDAKGYKLFDLDATGKHKTNYTYFADGSLASEHYPNGGTLAYAYDKEGNTVSVTASTEDGEGNTNVTHYTAGLVTRVESGNHVVEYEYDGKRRLTKVKLDGRDYESHAYTDHADGTETITTYFNNTEDIVIKNAKGDVIQFNLDCMSEFHYEYEPDGRIKKRRDQYSGREYTHAYTPEKHLEKYTDSYGVEETMTYDDKGRLSTKEDKSAIFASGSPETTLEYAYSYDEERDRVSQMRVAGYNIAPSYDALGRSTGKKISVGTAVKASEKITYLKQGDHTTDLPSVLKLKNATEETRIKYSYDEMGNIVKIAEDGIVSSRYEYDALGRLTREDNRAFGKTSLWEYDENGNILFRREYAFSVKPTEELTENDPVNVVEYKYDGDRLISYNGDTGFSYDTNKMPIKYRGKDASFVGRVLYGYGEQGLSYDGNTLPRSIGGIMPSYDENSNITSDNYFHYIYSYDGTLLGCLSKTTNGEKYFYQRDVQGNIVAMLDNAGNVVVRYKYNAWGLCKVLNPNGTENTSATFVGNQNPFRYRGYYYCRDLGFYYLKSRFYDPEVGRFISADAVDYLAPQNINGLNLYAYCNNNPVMNVDPDGHFWDYLFDMMFLAWSFADVINDPSDWRNWVALSVDILFAVIPFVPSGVGQVIKTGNNIDNAADLFKAANALDNLTDLRKVTVVGQTMSRVQNTAKSFNALDNLYDGFSAYTKWADRGKSWKALAEIVGKSQNAFWLYKKLRSGFTVLDIGVDLKRVAEGAKSASYAMERWILMVWQSRNIWKIPVNCFF